MEVNFAKESEPASASTVIAGLMFGLFLAMWLFKLCLLCASTRTNTAVQIVSSVCINTKEYSSSNCVFCVYQHERIQLFQLCLLCVSTRTNTAVPIVPSLCIKRTNTAVPIVSSLCFNTNEYSCSNCVFSVYQHEGIQLFHLRLLCVSTRTNTAVPLVSSLCKHGSVVMISKTVWNKWAVVYLSRTAIHIQPCSWRFIIDAEPPNTNQTPDNDLVRLPVKLDPAGPDVPYSLLILLWPN